MKNKIILAVLLVIFLIIIGYVVKNKIDNKERELKRNELKKNQDDHYVDKTFLEENYDKLESLYEQVEGELQNLVKYTKESDILNKIGDYMIIYTNSDKMERINYRANLHNGKQIVLCKGKIVADLSTKELIDFIVENKELYNTIKKTGETDIIVDIFLEQNMEMSGKIEIDFGINTDFTPFITNNNGIRNTFLYTETEEDMEEYGYKKIKELWYMQITPRPE